MPGYIGFRPQFNPLSLQEVLAVPTTILGEYGKAEDTYNETATKAEALKALLGERNADNEAGWRIVDNYERQLGDLADVMSKGIQGPETYRQAKNSLKFYRENMLPLESGIPAYQEELKKYNSDPTMIGTRPTLESYIKNPLYRAQMMSGSVIQNEATKAATSASARRKQETADRLIRGGQYYSYRELTGFSPEEVAAWLQDHNNSPELSAIYNQIKDKYEQSGYTEDQFKQYIERGIIDGITYDNKRHDAENKQWTLDHTANSGNRSTDNLQTKINNYLNGSSQWGRVGIEMNVGTTGRTDLKDSKGNLARLENGKVVGLKNDKDLIKSLGTIRIRPKFGNTAGNYRQFDLDETYLFDDNGKLRTPEELKQYIKSKLSIKKGTKGKTDDGKYFTYNNDVPFDEIYSDFSIDDYTKAYQQLLDVGFNPSQQFGVSYQEGLQRINGQTYPISTRDFNKKRAFKEFKETINPLYQSDATATQFGFYTYPIQINDMDRFIKEIPTTQLYEFEGMTSEKDNVSGNYVRKAKLGKHASKSALQAANKDANIGLHMSYDPVTKGFIWYTNDENPKYWYMKATDLDRSISTQDYTNIDFQKAAAAEKMLNERIQQLLFLYQNNPNNQEVQMELYLLLTELEKQGDVNQNAFNILMSGLDRTFFQKWGTHTVNTSEDEEKAQQALMQQYLMMP